MIIEHNLELISWERILLLTGEQVRAGYGRLEVLHDVSLHVEEGEIVTVLGPNGTGKTTLLRLLSGVLPVWSGSVSFDGARPWPTWTASSTGSRRTCSTRRTSSRPTLRG